MHVLCHIYDWLQSIRRHTIAGARVCFLELRHVVMHMRAQAHACACTCTHAISASIQDSIGHKQKAGIIKLCGAYTNKYAN